MTDNKKNSLEERYVATLIGCALGDTLGMPVESWKKEQIQYYVGKITEPIDPVLIKNKKKLVTEDKFGKLKYYTKDLKKGEYTDDTILTLSIAESIAEKKCLNFNDICEKQIKAYNSCIMKSGRVKGGWGRTTKLAFEKIKSGTSPLESAVEPGLGNGVAMKMSPLGLYMHATEKYDEGLEIARLIGKSTHADERAVAAGIVQAHAIYFLLKNNSTREQFIDSLVSLCETQEKPFNTSFLPERGNLTSKLKWIKENLNAEDSQAHKYLGNVCLVLESYPFSIFMFQKYWDKPLEGLIETVNFGGDCDTTAAIYGSLCGAKNGMIFPEEWLKILKNSDKLKEAAKQIYAIRNSGGKNDI